MPGERPRRVYTPSGPNERHYVQLDVGIPTRHSHCLLTTSHDCVVSYVTIEIWCLSWWQLRSASMAAPQIVAMTSCGATSDLASWRIRFSVNMFGAGLLRVWLFKSTWLLVEFNCIPQSSASSLLCTPYPLRGTPLVTYIWRLTSWILLLGAS